MDRLRYDIVEHKGIWLLTDGHEPPRAFRSSAEALQVAQAEAKARAIPTEIHLWRNGVSTQVTPR